MQLVSAKVDDRVDSEAAYRNTNQAAARTKSVKRFEIAVMLDTKKQVAISLKGSPQMAQVIVGRRFSRTHSFSRSTTRTSGACCVYPEAPA